MKIDISKITASALNERGAKTAVRMGIPVEIGKPGPFLDAHWSSDAVLVFVMALPIVVRLISNRTLVKERDPIVICMDEAGIYVIPVLGGHRGANRIAEELAQRSGATAVVTTASDQANLAAIDGLSGFVAVGNVAAVIESMLDGNLPFVRQDIDWPAPIQLRDGNGPAQIIISDSIPSLGEEPLMAQLIPPSLVLGVGCSSDATIADISQLIADTLEAHNLDFRSVSKIATVQGRADHPSIKAQRLPIEAFTASELDQVSVPNPSADVARHVDTKSVAEAAAILSSGSLSLLVPKAKNARATVAVARRKPRGSLTLVGLGPGTAMMRTPEATSAIISSEIVVGYMPYISQCESLLAPHQLVIRSPIGSEVERVNQALEYALQGRQVAVVCSGDPEVFAMASVAFEVMDSYHHDNGTLSPLELIEVKVIAGVTAGLGAGALLGAPLGHDHAYLSLSDLLTPWDVIESRLNALGMADMVIVIYNPQSNTRRWQLTRAVEILSKHRPRSTPVAIVQSVGRDEQSRTLSTIATFDPESVNMTSLVIVGSSKTKRTGEYLFTPRGYRV